MTYNSNNVDPVPTSEYPTFTPVIATTPPDMPEAWAAISEPPAAQRRNEERKFFFAPCCNVNW